MGQAGELRFRKTGPREPVKISEEERKLWRGECLLCQVPEYFRSPWWNVLFMYLYTRCCPQQDFCAYLFSLKGMTTNDLVTKLFQVLDFVLRFLPLGVIEEKCVL